MGVLSSLPGWVPPPCPELEALVRLPQCGLLLPLAPATEKCLLTEAQRAGPAAATGDVAVLSGPLLPGKGWTLACQPAWLSDTFSWHCRDMALTEEKPE